MTDLGVPADIRRVEHGYRNALRLRMLSSSAALTIGAIVAALALREDFPVIIALPIIVAVAAIAAIVVVPARIYRRLGYALDARVLRVVRGWLFHTDTVVPLVRVQHIDVARGPIDKLCGIAQLVVHTAGTHNSVVTLPGLSPDRAFEIRDAIRAEIRADSE